MAPSDENTPLLAERGELSDSGTYSSVERGIDANDIGDKATEYVNKQTDDTSSSKQGSLVTIFAIWSSMMGTSLLAMPWAFQQAGIIQGMVLQLLLAAIAAYTGMLVLKSSRRYADSSGVIPEFAVVCQKLFGKFGTILTTQCSVIVFVGALIVYWILMSELLYNSVNSIHYFSSRSSPPSATNNRTNLLNTIQNKTPLPNSYTTDVMFNQTVCPSKESNLTKNLTPIPAWSENHTVPFFLVILFAPLVQLRSVTFFTRFGAAGCIPVIFLVIYSIIKSSSWGFNANFQDETDVQYTELFNGNFPAFSGVMTMAFFTHNSIVTFFKHAKHPENSVRDLSISYVLVIVTYAVIGVSIYLAFPGDKMCIKQNFFENISVSDTLSLVAQLMLFFRLVTLFPLVTYILRVQIFVPFTGKEYPGHLPVGILNVIIIALCVFCAVFYPNIGDIVRYAGAFCGMIYMFLLPCIVDAILQRREDKRTGKKMHIGQMILHIIISILGVGNFFAQFAVAS